MSSSWSQDSYLKAYWFAAEAHNGQPYKGTELPYTMHFSFVAMEVMAALSVESGLDGNLAVQCALLHDTLEDTSVTHEHLADTFGLAVADVADGVHALTKDENVGAELDEKDVGKRLRMKDCLERIQKQPREIWMVKMADRITNLQPPPVSWSDEKIENYRREAALILGALKDASAFLAQRLEKNHRISEMRWKEGRKEGRKEAQTKT